MRTEQAVYRPPSRADDPSVCGRCRRHWGSSLVEPPAHYFVIGNTRTGKYHSGGDYGMTDCGQDATADHWMWPL